MTDNDMNMLVHELNMLQINRQFQGTCL